MTYDQATIELNRQSAENGRAIIVEYQLLTELGKEDQEAWSEYDVTVMLITDVCQRLSAIGIAPEKALHAGLDTFRKMYRGEI